MDSGRAVNTSRISIVMATRNRCATLLHTLDRIHACCAGGSRPEIILVDNASTDGTREAAISRVDRVIRLPRNEGSCAKTHGCAVASGDVVVFLDDDSYPRPGSLARMLLRFDDDDALAAAGFRIHLPGGTEEGAALPDVFVGCGVGLRRTALLASGGLDRSFFMQAEEYDLAFRLTIAGWKVRMFDDLHVEHLKTPEARRPARTSYYDIRNNLVVLARYLPRAAIQPHMEDCVTRYRWLAQRLDHVRTFRRGLRAGTARASLDRWRFRHRRLTRPDFEHFYGWRLIEKEMSDIAGQGIRRVVLAGWGKGCFSFHRAAQHAGIAMTAIGDDTFGAPDRCYRGIPILPLEKALDRPVDAIVVSNQSPAHASAAADRVRNQTSTPVFAWFARGVARTTGGINSATVVHSSDDTGAVCAGAAGR